MAKKSCLLLRRFLHIQLFFSAALFMEILCINREDYKYPYEEQEDTEPADPPKEYPEENLKEGQGAELGDDATYPPEEKMQGRGFKFGGVDLWKWKTMNIFINRSVFNEQEVEIIETAASKLYKILKPCGVHIGIFKPDETPYGDFVNVVDSRHGCSAAQGRFGGEQRLYLRRSFPNGGTCVTLRLVLHELMHALGFGHEHTRHDRDEHIEIFWDDLQGNGAWNFNKDPREETFGIPYNVRSIMHYEDTAFAKPGKVSMKSKKGHPIKYGRVLLQKTDIEMIKKVYCTEKKPPAPPASSNYDSVKDLLKKYDDHEG